MLYVKLLMIDIIISNKNSYKINVCLCVLLLLPVYCFRCSDMPTYTTVIYKFEIKKKKTYSFKNKYFELTFLFFVQD